MAELKTEKPKLTWIDIAITVTLLASIVGLAAWLLSGKFSYVAAPASSLGLVNLLKKPKEDDTTQTEGSGSSEQEASAVIPPAPQPTAIDGIVDGTDGYLPSTVDTPPFPSEDPSVDPIWNDESGSPSADPFDGSLLEVSPSVSDAVPLENPTIDPSSPNLSEPSLEPVAPPRPTISTATPEDQPIRYLSEHYDQGERNFQNFDLRNVDLNHRLLRLVGADLRELKAERANLQQADLTQANLGRADLQYAKLDGANLSYTNLAAANLRGASLRGVNLRDAKLMDAQLAIADLSYADLSGADLSGADLTDTNLYRARLDGTKLPEMARPV
ncbi:MAG: hypothetical protein EAZ61_08645 [Oscillatoriales cyanobacterium]|nr:MAG: hypothetical protein EAZ61_08645 [Oscillatoriales cyanobacterium]